MINISDELVDKITKEVVSYIDNLNKIPVGISSRHIHLTKENVDDLFGKGYELTVMKPLSQPGQYACNETVDIIGPKGSIERVRVLGPIRKETQVEVSKTDAFKLGLNPPVRGSGNVTNTPSITIKNGNKSINVDHGVIIAERHIHMSEEDANRFVVKDGDIVNVLVKTDRGGIFNNVVVRVNKNYSLDFHIDTDEGNAFGLKTGDLVEIIR